MLDLTHLESFCGGQSFWDYHLTWNSSDPDFTECFQKTILSWIPSTILGLLSPVELYLLCRSKGYIPWTILNITKILVCSALVILTAIPLGSTLVHSEYWLDITPVDVITPAIKIVTYVLALAYTVLEMKKGLQTSGVQWAFWLFSTLTGAVIYRSFLRKALEQYDEMNEVDFSTEMAIFPLIVLQFILSCLADANPIGASLDLVEDYSYDNKDPSPEMSASFPSRLFFSWFDRMAIRGFRTDLETSDLWQLNPRDRSRTVFPIFEKFWQREVDRFSKHLSRTKAPVNQDKELFSQFVQPSDSAESSTQPSMKKAEPSITMVLFRSFGWLYIFGTFLKFTVDLLQFVNPMILDQLIKFAASDLPLWRGFLYAGLMLTVSVTNLVLIGRSSHIAYLVGMRIRSALISAIYRKALRLSSGTKRNYTMGEIVNLMAVDVQRLVDVTVLFNLAWTTPIQFSIAMYLLWQRLGPSVLAGIAVLLTLILLTIGTSGYAKKLQTHQMELKDHRIKLMNEILNGIKVLKLYAWETCFMDIVNGIRGKEIKVLRTAAYFATGMNFAWMSSAILIAAVTFSTYVLVDSDNILDANKAFVSLSLFSVMQTPIMLMPMAIMAMIQATIAVRRIKKFLMSEELDPDSVQHAFDERCAIKVENATFSWSYRESAVLLDLNLKVDTGSLVAVVGPVGAGKSSLVSAILGEMEKINGNVTISDSVAYTSQQAWMQNATIKDNILFGKPYRPAFYDKVIESCALRPDLQILPAGDDTEIGEKGINLSGGQKQRISLARAVYHEASIYLLDDPLSAVDVHVGTHIFDNVIGPKGLLRNKTRVLITHRITYLPQVDLIVVVNEGRISEVGTYKELLDKKGLFAEFLITYMADAENEEEAEGVEEIKEIMTKMGSPEHDTIFSRSISLTESEDGLKLLSLKASLEKSMKSQFSRSLSQHKNEDPADLHKGALTVVEAAETGKVKWDTYLYYAKTISGRVVVFTLLFYAIAYSCSMGSSIWLSIWSTDKPREDGTLDTGLRDLRLGVYAGLGLTSAIFILFAALFITYGTTKAAETLHSTMLQNVLRSPMSFFDTTPLGRIVNRFSKDVDMVDLSIPSILNMWIGTLFQVLGVIVVISIGAPLFLAAAVPNFILYYFLQKFYVATSRQLKRLESITRSPIYSHFSESVSGAATIRAFEKQGHFINQSEIRVDRNHECYYPSIISNRWIGIRLEVIGNILVFCAALLAVLGRGTLSPGVVGLIISYALSITLLLNWVVRFSSEFETNIVAVERIKEYTVTPTEADWEKPDKKPSEGWPSLGEISFDRYCTRYRKGLDLVLQKVTCNIKSGEKVGIVGRTGAGKSSLTQALFRIIEAADGCIRIDDQDISELGLHDLRSRLTIIPQDPVLFSGTLRMNLDPFDSHSDEDLWKALELSHLKSFVSSLPESLKHGVSEGGENLSVGQRQLVCLTRAVLRKTKILVLDEATAAVDLETDDLIQATIRKEFADCTVLTIAHRLNTIMDNDRILVLDQGRIKEFDSPSNLLQNKSSTFYGMAKDAGLVS